MGILDGKTALITGGGSGIGKSIALEFCKEGADVVIVGRTERKLFDTVLKSNARIHCFAGDVSDKKFVLSLFNEFRNNAITPDIIVNCAGVINVKDSTGKLNDEIVMNVNFMGTMNICSSAIDLLIKQNSPGSIINIASIAGHYGSSEFHSYAASKGAILAYTKSIAMNYGKNGIRANTISPGVIVTPMSYIETPDFDNYIPEMIEMHPIGRLGAPLDIAKAALFFASSMSEWITGQDLIVDGGYTLRE